MNRCANKRGSLMTGFAELDLILTSLFECLFISFNRSDIVCQIGLIVRAVVT